MWLRTGLPIVLQTDLATATKMAASLAEDQSQAYQLHASEVLRVTLELRRHEWRAQVTIVDPSTERLSNSFVVNGPESGGVIGVANVIASRLDDRASVFSTHQDSALRAYVEAAISADPQLRVTGFQKAMELDPNFGLAYLSAIDLAGRSDPTSAADLLHRASEHRDRFTPLDQARFDTLRTRLSHVSLENQATAAAALLKLTPNSLDALLTLASLRFLQGDATAGKQLCERALSLSPGNATVRTYLALGLVESKRFREAESVFESLGADAITLPKLAVCVLLEGDLARADSVFARYLKTQEGSGEPALPLIRANWLAITGRVQEAVTLLKATRFSSPALQSVALSQSAIWELMGKDNTGALADARASLALAPSGTIKALASAAYALSAPGQTPESIRNRVNAAALNEDQRMLVVAYGLFLSGHFAEAVEAWRTLSEGSGDTDLRSRAMLAASLNRAGKPAAANGPPVEPFIPNVSESDQFAAVAFGEMRRLLSR